MSAPKPGQRATATGETRAHRPNLRQRILVVEDDAGIRQLNTEVLTYSGYQVDAAKDGAAAWDALQREHYDLMITDNAMPRLSGIELIEKLQTAAMALPVIMATGAMPDQKLDRYKLLQPEKILLKPYTFHELLAAVKEVLYDANADKGEAVPPPNWQVSSLRSTRP
jgi:two-component system alkaline phosphatase synthesis response regulator PhoP